MEVSRADALCETPKLSPIFAPSYYSKLVHCFFQRSRIFIALSCFQESPNCIPKSGYCATVKIYCASWTRWTLPTWESEAVNLRFRVRLLTFIKSDMTSEQWAAEDEPWGGRAASSVVTEISPKVSLSNFGVPPKICQKHLNIGQKVIGFFLGLTTSQTICSIFKYHKKNFSKKKRFALLFRKESIYVGSCILQRIFVI